MRNSILAIAIIALIISTGAFIGRIINIAFQDNASIDAFGRLRVSDPFTIFDSKLYNDDAPLIWDELLSGTAGSSFVDATSSVVITTSANNDYAIRQSFQRFGYQPGKSAKITFTGLIGLNANVTKRYGYFNSGTVAPYADSLDGIWFEQVGGSADSSYWVVGRIGTKTRVAKDDWNIDPMDGTGPSDQTLDITDAQVFFIDFAWLGYSRVRVGFVIEGKVYYVHEFDTANISDFPYMNSPNHSMRAEIRQTGAGSGTMTMTCNEVESEGGINPGGILRTVNSAGVSLAASTEDSTYALIGLRLKDTHRDAIVDFESVCAIVTSTSDNAMWELIINPAIAGAPSWVNLPNSALQYFRGATANTVTGGTRIASGFIASGNAASGAGTLSSSLEQAIRLGVEIDRGKNTAVLCITPIGGSSNVAVEGAFHITLKLCPYVAP